MITYLKMKRNEIKVKAALYKIAANIMDSQKDLLDLFQKMFVALKDVPEEELKAEFISKLAEIIHDENKTE